MTESSDMPDPAHLELIHAEIDSELDAEQRAELARLLLADPAARALRDGLKRVCAAVEALEQVEPPAGLRGSVLAALPHAPAQPAQSWWSTPRWRYAAVAAGLVAGGVVLLVVMNGTQRATTDAAGTMTAPPVTLDTVRLKGDLVSGRVSLFRDGPSFGLDVDLESSAPVDVLVVGGGRSLRIRGLGGPGRPLESTRVPLPGFAANGQPLTVTLLRGNQPVGSATLRAPE